MEVLSKYFYNLLDKETQIGKNWCRDVVYRGQCLLQVMWLQ